MKNLCPGKQYHVESERKVVKLSLLFDLELGNRYLIIAQMSERKAIKMLRKIFPKSAYIDSEVNKKHERAKLNLACLIADHETERNRAVSKWL